MANRETQSVNRALRLTFSYEGSNIQLVSEQRLEMLAPPTDHLVVRGELAGFWCELRDTEDQVIYRRILQNPIQTGFEAPVGEQGHQLSWETASQPLKGIFVVVAPALANATSVVLFGSPSGPDGSNKPARELARFTLKQRPEGEGRAQ